MNALRRLSLAAIVLAAAACGPEIEDSSSSSPAGSDPTPAPGATPPPASMKPATLDQALARFGECMELSTWESIGMEDVAWQSAESDAGGGRCFSCHETGTGAALLSQDPLTFFEENRTRPYILRLVLGTVDESGAFDDLVPAWRFRDKGTDPNHPSYILTEERETAIDGFVSLTLERYHDYALDCSATVPEP